MPLYPATNFLQSSSIVISTNTTTTATSTSPAQLTSMAITTSGNTKLMLQFVASCSNSTTSTKLYFQLLVDNVLQEASAVRYVAAPSVTCVLMATVAGLSAGTHYVTVNWYVSSGTGQIRPISASTAEFATLTAMEVLT